MFFDLRFASRWRNNGDPILLVSTDKNQKNQGTKSENFLPRKSYLDMECKISYHDHNFFEPTTTKQ